MIKALKISVSRKAQHFIIPKEMQESRKQRKILVKNRSVNPL